MSNAETKDDQTSQANRSRETLVTDSPNPKSDLTVGGRRETASAHDRENVYRQIINSPRIFSGVPWHCGLALAISDLAAVTLSTALSIVAILAYKTFFNFTPAWHLAHEGWAPFVLVESAVVIIWWFSLLQGHYKRLKPFWIELQDIARVTAYAAATAIAILYLTDSDAPKSQLLSAFLLMLLLVPLLRQLTRLALQRANYWFVPLIIVGDYKHAKTCRDAIERESNLGYKAAAMVVYDSAQALDVLHRDRNLLEEITEITNMYPRNSVLLALGDNGDMTHQDSLVEKLAESTHHVFISRSTRGFMASRIDSLEIDKFDGLFLRVSYGGIHGVRGTIKRVADICGAILIFCILAPLALLASILVLSDGGRILYRSKRIGLHGKYFDCLKFRTMKHDANTALATLLQNDPELRNEWKGGFKLSNDPRITHFGKILRQSSIDELPQLLNVIRGDMSLVGPRPILPEELDAYGDRLPAYQRVRPGLTGLWQVSGRSNVGYQERIDLNQWYVRNWSLWLDFTILLRTVPALLKISDAR